MEAVEDLFPGNRLIVKGRSCGQRQVPSVMQKTSKKVFRKKDKAYQKSMYQCMIRSGISGEKKARHRAGYRMEHRMKKKIIPVLVAIVLILIIGGIALGGEILQRYSYSKERASLDEYYQVSGDQAAIILQDEMLSEKALLRNGRCYFDIDTVRSYLNEIFYADEQEGLLLYTTAQDTAQVAFGDNVVYYQDGQQQLDYTPVFSENGIVYVAADYVKLHTNLSVSVYDRHVQVYTQWGTKQVDIVKKDTNVRIRGGVKSPILCELSKGEQVEVLEQMETWTKVKTQDAVIGYVENKLLENISKGQASTEEETPVTDYTAPEYTAKAVDGKLCLGWHAIGGQAGNATLENMVAGTQGLKVIAPTWFSLTDNEGNYRSFGEKSYVDRAHAQGIMVWGVLDDFNYRNETGAAIDDQEALSYTSKRERLISQVIAEALNLGLDGINLDFEKVSAEAESHYVQFLRELSVACRKNNLYFSIDDYAPFNFNNHYRLDVQGQVADYVIIMGYDEHWHGSKDPGSVASISYVKNGLERALLDVPAQKLVNGLPFYTIVWKTEGGTVTDEYLTIRNTAEYLSKVGAQASWDEETCQNYAEWMEGQTKYQIWLEDTESINAKLGVMSANNIGGVAVWRLGYGNADVWNLINGYVQQ